MTTTTRNDDDGGAVVVVPVASSSSVRASSSFSVRAAAAAAAAVGAATALLRLSLSAAEATRPPGGLPPPPALDRRSLPATTTTTLGVFAAAFVSPWPASSSFRPTSPRARRGADDARRAERRRRRRGRRRRASSTEESEAGSEEAAGEGSSTTTTTIAAAAPPIADGRRGKKNAALDVVVDDGDDDESLRRRLPGRIYRRDCREPPFRVPRIDLNFDFRRSSSPSSDDGVGGGDGKGGGGGGGDRAIVTSSLTVVPNVDVDVDDVDDAPDNVGGGRRRRRRSDGDDDERDLVLDGDSRTVSLKRISIVVPPSVGGGDDDDVVVDEEEEEESVLAEGIDYERRPDRIVVRSSSMFPLPTDDDDDGICSSSATTTTTTGATPLCELRIVVETTVLDDGGELSGLFKRPSGKRKNDDGSVGEEAIYSHCEPCGFRRVTYFPDRPDNVSTFGRVRIEADGDAYPLLLSNGNLIESGDVLDGAPPEDEAANGGVGRNDDAGEGGGRGRRRRRHYAVFADPNPKPCYLFALVLGPPSWDCLAETHSINAKNADLLVENNDGNENDGRDVRLRLHADRSSLPRLTFALSVLRKVMTWDERTYGLPYDLDEYDIVSSDAFHVGAMENKGLNLFQTSLLAASPHTTTDVTYDLIEKTVAHEYLHNWSGNKVTLKNWFEFALKEGLTVFRDQEYTKSASGRGCATRIEAVKLLREKQFAEDADVATMHPVRPESVAAAATADGSSPPSSSSRPNSVVMDGLWTSTTYHKGAEVVRMCQTILGRETFVRGLRRYFRRNVGGAATCDDFLDAMRSVSTDSPSRDDVDWDQFALWYSTPGTPVVSYTHSFDPTTGRFELTLSQSIPALGEEGAPILHIPVVVGLLDGTTGEEIVPDTVLHLNEATKTFVIDGLNGRAGDGGVVPSLLRDFSAPVRLVRDDDGGGDGDGDDREGEGATASSGGTEEFRALAFLAAHDADGFNRWEAMQGLLSSFVYSLLSDGGRGEERATRASTLASSSKSIVEECSYEAFRRTLTDATIDHASKARMLALPTESVLSRNDGVSGTAPDPVRLREARGEVRSRIGREFKTELLREYEALTAKMKSGGTFGDVDAASRSARSLRNALLEYICHSSSPTSANDDDEDECRDVSDLVTEHFDSARCLTDKLAPFRSMSSVSHDKLKPTRIELSHKFYAFALETRDPIVLDKWFQTHALSELPGALDVVRRLASAHPEFVTWSSERNANRFRSLVSTFVRHNRGGFHDAGGDGYAFAREVAARVDKVAPPLSAELVKALSSWRTYDEVRGSKMRKELEALAETRSLSRTLSRAVENALLPPSRDDDAKPVEGGTGPPPSNAGPFGTRRGGGGRRGGSTKGRRRTAGGGGTTAKKKSGFS